MRHNKLFIYLLIACILLNIISPLLTNAEEIKDYRDIDYKTATFKNVQKPTSQFGISINGSPDVLSFDGMDTGYTTPPLVVIYAKIGDKITVSDHSRSNRGKYIDMWDFQVSSPDGMDAYLTNSSSGFVTKYTNYTLTKDGVYNFYLCARDYLSPDDKQSITNGYGNWSDNGNHQALGINPGGDGVKGTADDFQGYWYYTQIRVIVQADGPEPDFSITHNGTDVTDNSTNKINRATNNLVVNLVDNSSIKSGSILKREWKYWSSSGWTKIPGQGTNDTSITIDSAALGINPDRIGFQLTAISDKGIAAYAAHDVYSTYASGLASIIVHYKDDKGATLAPDDTIKTDLDKPTTIYSIPIANYKADKASDVVTVPSSDPDKTVEYTFTYLPAAPSGTVSAQIDCNDTVVQGNDISIHGSGVDSTGAPVTLLWEINKPSWVQGTLQGNSSSIWFNQSGVITLKLTVISVNGSATVTKDIIVNPPYPNTIINTKDTRVNHKITADASTSTSSSMRYPIDWTKTVWEIAVEDSSKGLTISDVKTLHDYTLVTDAAGKQIIKITGDLKITELLTKKEGVISIYCKLTNTAGYTSYAKRIINITPDLPPLVDYSVTEYSLRDPNDNNLAPFDITDISTSPDGDSIGKRVWLYVFDSDNDGSFKYVTRNDDGSSKDTPLNETWYVYHNNNWIPVTEFGIDGSFDSLQNLDIDKINDGNKPSLVLKVNHVGMYAVFLIVREDITGDTIPEFVSASDQQIDSTFNHLNEIDFK